MCVFSVTRTVVSFLIIIATTGSQVLSGGTWNRTAALESLWGGNESSIFSDSNSSLFLPKNYNHELPPTPNPEKTEKWIQEQFETLQMDYSTFLLYMDYELDEQRRSTPERRRQVDKAAWLLELERTVPKVDIFNPKDQCNICRAGAGLLLHYLKELRSVDELKTVGFCFCVSIKAYTMRVCKAEMDVFMEELVYILKRISLTPEEICNFMLANQCGEFNHSSYNWNVTLPPVTKPLGKIPKPSPNSEAIFKVLHLADIHYDPYYLEGTNADCGEPLCCRLINGPANSAEKAAGRWGDYRVCDTPKRTLQNMLEQITKVHPDIDYILWTGDAYPHNALNITKEDVIMVLKETADMLHTTFPSIPIFPALGNHDTLPPNSFPLPPYNKDVDMAWLYDTLERQWSQMLFNYTLSTVQRGAFYSVMVRPGFRIISLNTVLCSSSNWWLLLNSTDPAKMLEWFIVELQMAEMKGEKVHVIGHIPPGLCTKEWRRNYNDIVSRYESTITAQFFAHTHNDEFELFFDSNDINSAVGIAYIGPSVTPFINVNPGYRIYYVDGDHSTTTRSVIDHETWVMNLNEANLYSPVWYKLYSTRVTYKMQSLSPQEWDDFIIRMAKDQDLFNLYYTHYTKNSSASKNCDTDCKKQLLCDLRAGRSHHRQELCQEIENIIGASSRINYSCLLLLLPIVLPFYNLAYKNWVFEE